MTPLFKSLLLELSITSSLIHSNCYIYCLYSLLKSLLCAFWSLYSPRLPIFLFHFSFSLINFGRLLQFYLPFHAVSLWLALISCLTYLLSIVLPITVFFISIIFMVLFQIFFFVSIMSFSCLLDSLSYMYILSNLILKFYSYWSTGITCDSLGMTIYCACWWSPRASDFFKSCLDHIFSMKNF